MGAIRFIFEFMTKGFHAPPARGEGLGTLSGPSDDAGERHLKTFQLGVNK